MTRQRIAITGSSGLIGGALSAYLHERGDDVIRLVRRAPASPSEVRIDGGDPQRLADALSSCQAVVNLAGAGVASHRWTGPYRAQLHSSRVGTTTSLVRALALLDRPVRLVSSSATGVYGTREDEVLTESSAPGQGFLAQLCLDWEDAAMAAQASGHVVACLRTGLVVSSRSGAFHHLGHLTRFGLGGRLGNGRQWWSIISLRDEVRAIAHLIDRPDVVGPVNAVSPIAHRQREIADAMGRSLLRPALIPAPRAALRLTLGELSDEVLASRRVHPVVLQNSGFTWLDGNLDQLLDRVAADLSGPATR